MSTCCVSPSAVASTTTKPMSKPMSKAEAKAEAPTWYEMWAQGFPESDTSPEGLVVVSTFPEMLASCRRGNYASIVVMGCLLLREAIEDTIHLRNFALVIMTANIFAAWSNLYWIPRAESTHGILYAHRVFVRISVVNTLFITYCLTTSGQHAMLRHKVDPHFEDVASKASPLYAVLFSSLVLLLVGGVHLAMIPLKYRAVVHAGMATIMITAPRYSQLVRTPPHGLEPARTVA